MAENILQSEILVDFVYPFLLIFFIIFAVLEKTKIFGDEKHQLNALVSFVVGLIFVGAVFPKMVVGNLVLFLAVAIVIVFVILLLWGFITGSSEAKFSSQPLQIIAGIVVLIAVIIAVFLITGIWDEVSDFLFGGTDSEEVWTNVVFIAIIIIALIVILIGAKKAAS